MERQRVVSVERARSGYEIKQAAPASTSMSAPATRGRNVLSTTASGPEFLSLDLLDLNRNPPAFRAMVLGIPGDSKDCPKRRMFIRTYGPTAWKRPCDVVVRWNGSKFTYEAL